MKKVVCRIIGHKKTRVTFVTHNDGSRMYFSHPNGDRTACRRCRRVLKEKP